MLNRETKIRLSFGTGLIIFLLIVGLAVSIFIRDMMPSGEETLPPLPEVSDSQQSETEEVPLSPEPVSNETPVPPTSALTKPEVPPEPKYMKTLVFVIDDAGNNLHDLEPFLRFPGPLTIAVLPGLPYSAETARRIRAAGKEVILHQPMEAIGGQYPGPGAIYSGMTPEEIRAIAVRNLTEIGPVAGMNNHQGSKVTMDALAMETVLTLCREQGIYFLDSKTIADSVAPIVAKHIGMKIAERDVFLDNIQEKAAMLRYVNEGLKTADHQGIAVMIGHTWSPALAPLLTELYPDFIAQGYSFATIASLK